MSSYQLSRKVKSMVEEEDATARLRYSRSLVRQNKPLNDDSRAPHVWSTTITSLPERVLSFALNSLTDTLPHNANLHLWKKVSSAACDLCGNPQTLLHVLNSCPYVLEKRRYKDRHNSILEAIHSFLVDLLPAIKSITVDLPSHSYSFPQQIVCTDT